MKKVIILTIIVVMSWAILVTCQSSDKADTAKSQDIKKGEVTMIKLDITSAAFKEGETIPTQYTCDGSNVSVPLAWSKAPEGTKSLVLICDDPDAPMGTWVHWVVINLPPELTGLPEGAAIADDSSTAGAIECHNDFGRTIYGGPCPPKGPAHRYFFKLYALDTTLSLTKDADKADVEQAMKGHILAQGQLMGKYGR